MDDIVITRPSQIRPGVISSCQHQQRRCLSPAQLNPVPDAGIGGRVGDFLLSSTHKIGLRSVGALAAAGHSSSASIWQKVRRSPDTVCDEGGERDETMTTFDRDQRWN
jgi:hypothetical protein